MTLTLTSLLILAVVIVAIYYFVKFIVSPFVRLIAGIIIFLIIIYILQRFFDFNLVQALGPFGKYLNFSKWSINTIEITNLINYYLNQALSILHK